MPSHNSLKIQFGECFHRVHKSKFTVSLLIKPSFPAFALNGLSGYVFIDKAALFSPEYLASRIPAPALLKPASHSDHAASVKRDTSHRDKTLHWLLGKGLVLLSLSKLNSGHLEYLTNNNYF